MSVRFDTDTDKMVATLSAALTIGTGDFNLMLSVKFNGLFAAAVAQDILIIDTADPGTGNGFGFGIPNSNAAQVAAYRDTSPIYFGAYTYAAGVQYHLFLTRASGTLRYRVFEDTPSSTPVSNSTTAWTTDITGLDTLIFGAKSGGSGCAPVDIINFKIQTGTSGEWTNAECVTEYQNWGIQKAGGTDRLSIRLWNTADSFTGRRSIPEQGQVTAALSNTGCVDGPTQPEQLAVLGAHLEALTKYAPPDSTTAITVSHTCTGANRYLLVGFGDGYNEHGAFTVGPKYAGVDMAQVADGGITVDLNSRMRVLGLVAPASGANNFTVTQVLGNGREALLIASYAHVDQTAPVTATADAKADTGSPSLTIAGDAVTVDFLCWYQNTASPTIGAGQAYRAQQQVATGGFYCADMSEEYGTGTRTMSWGGDTGTGWSQAAVSLKSHPVVVVTKTVKSAGGGDHTTLQAAIDAFAPDLRYANQRVIFECYAGNIAGGVFDYTAWRSDAERFVTITAGADRHLGVYSTAKSYLSAAFVSGNVGLIRNFPDYSVIEWMQIEQTGDDQSFRGIMNTGYDANRGPKRAAWQTIRYNLIKTAADGSTYWNNCVGIDGGVDVPGDLFIYGNILYGWDIKTTCCGISVTQHTVGKTYCYNNTVVDCAIGIKDGYTKIDARNNLVKASVTDFSGAFDGASDYNASTLTGAPGANSRQSQTFTFVNEAGKDYHLSRSDAGARGLGVNLGTPYDVDIDGEVRVAPWDIGADYVPGDSTRTPYNELLGWRDHSGAPTSRARAPRMIRGF